MRDVSHVLICFNGVYTLVIQDERSGLRINLFHVRVAIASSSLKVEDDHDCGCNAPPTIGTVTELHWDAIQHGMVQMCLRHTEQWKGSGGVGDEVEVGG
jgi:hypothetical protein